MKPISEHTAEHTSTQPTALCAQCAARMLTEQDHSRRIRLIPPIAALSAAGALQIIAVTDLLGAAISAQLGIWGYVIGAIFGCAVAATFEGGAAHLMALYEKHLLACDSTWLLRLAMVGYVGASAAALHWWAASRGLPVILSWLLAAMSAAALFLWSRESRWKHRTQMRAAGQIDTALPRLSTSAKVLHPLRSAITLWLISWDQASSTDDARAHYAAWRQSRRSPASQSVSSEQPIRAQAITEHAPAHRAEQVSTQAPITPSTEQSALCGEVIADGEQEAPSTEQSAEHRTHTRTISVTEQYTEQVSTNGKPSIEQLASTLNGAFADHIPGRPSALKVLRAEHGSCSEPRAKAAIELLAQIRATTTTEE
jgi:hypothetical protein